MPGIVGLVSRRPADECAGLVEEMIGSMLHEPFYVTGTYDAAELGIYGGWVAHQESFAAEESGADDANDLGVLFSGECYSDGRDDSIAEQYRRRREGFVESLNGLFAGLVIDRERSAAFLFNDRYGFDRVYIAEVDDELYFASEAKALLAVLSSSRAFDPEGVVDFLTYGCTVENRTLFRGITLLPPGSLWSVENGRIAKRSYFEVESWESQDLVDGPQLQAQFNEIVTAAVPKYFKDSANRLGISLTAGLDSRVVIAAQPRPAELPVCYTYDAVAGETLDTRLAAEVAKSAGCTHRVVRLQPNFFSDFATHAERTVYITDGNVGPSGAHEIYLSRVARALAPVRLTGVFGGEIFRGVSTFKPLGLDTRLLDPSVGRGVTTRTQALPTDRTHPVTAAAFQEIPWSIFGSVAACRSQLSFRTPFMDNEVVALSYRIPQMLRGTVGEVFARFINQRSPQLAAIPTDMGMLGARSKLRRFRARAAAKATFKLDYWLNDGMPHRLSYLDGVVQRLSAATSVVGRHKYLSYRRWFRGELADYVRQSLASSSLRDNGLWNKSFLSKLAEQHISGRANLLQEINAVITLDSVERQFFKPAPREERLATSRA